MLVAGGTIGAIVAAFLAEKLGGACARTLRRRGWPFEFQHIPLFVLLFSALYGIHSIVLFPPTLSLLMKFGMLYSVAGVVLLLLLTGMKQLHYQTYIFIVNWFQRE